MAGTVKRFFQISIPLLTGKCIYTRKRRVYRDRPSIVEPFNHVSFAVPRENGMRYWCVVAKCVAV